MRQKFGNMKVGMIPLVILVFSFLSACNEDEISNSHSSAPELGKPIVFDYDPNVQNSFQDTYYEMDLDFYIPEGIEELKNRPLLFTISTLRDKSVTGSMLDIIKSNGMIAVSPKNGDSNQYKSFLEALIETEYVDPSNVYLAGFSSGGFQAYELARIVTDIVKGVVLLDPATFSAIEGQDNSTLSVCIVCQEERIERYAYAVSELKTNGIRTKLIAVQGSDHGGILSAYTAQEKVDCFEFVKNSK